MSEREVTVRMRMSVTMRLVAATTWTTCVETSCTKVKCADWSLPRSSRPHTGKLVLVVEGTHNTAPKSSRCVKAACRPMHVRIPGCHVDVASQERVI